MTSRVLCLAFALLAVCNIASAQPGRKSNIHIGLFYPLSTNGINAADYSNLVSLHGLVGVSGSERALCASGFGSVVTDSAHGLMAGGFFNVVGKSATGTQAAGFINYIGNSATGLQAAGFINVTGSARGAQLAGFANIASRNVAGLQAAGFINEAKNVHTQVGGFINVADSVNGSQLSGFINIAGKVKGVQLAGFINIADSSDYPVGIINIIKKGQKAIGVTIDETGTTLASFRSGGRVLYGIIGAGFNFNYATNLYAFQAGLGARKQLNKYVSLGGEITTTSLTDFWWGSYMNAAIRVMPSVKIRKLEAFAGPSINYAMFSYGMGNGLVNNTLWHESIYYRSHDLHIGFLAGVQYHL